MKKLQKASFASLFVLVIIKNGEVMKKIVLLFSLLLSFQSFSYGYISTACLAATTETDANLKRANIAVRSCAPRALEVMVARAQASATYCYNTCNYTGAYRNANACSVILRKVYVLADLYRSLCF